MDPFHLVGQTLAGKYRVTGVLGEGGFGVVYAAEHADLRQPVAIKCLKGAGGADYLREARLLFGLTHANIVRMYDAGEHRGVPYVVLELVRGTSLEQEIRERRALGPSELRGVFGSMLSALEHAHAHGVVHRDLKPSNVMIVRDASGAQAKLLDFGTANARTQSRFTEGVGITPRYAAPEQWDDRLAAIGPRTDLFAVGLMLEEAVTGAPMITGETIPTLIEQVMSPSRASRVGAVRADLPRALEAVINRATRVRPEERFASASEMRAALDVALGDSAARASSLPLGQTSSPLASTGLSPPQPARSLSQRSVGTAPRGESSAWLGCFFVPLVGLLAISGAIVFVAMKIAARAQPAPTSSAPADPSLREPPVALRPSPPLSPEPPPSLSIARGAPAPTRPSSPAPAPRSEDKAPKRALVYDAGVGSYGGLHPNAAGFVSVANARLPELKACFQSKSDAWSVIIRMHFTLDGGRGARVEVLHEGSPADEASAEAMRDCVLTPVASWPWPTPTQQGVSDLDGGLPYLVMTAGLVWR